MLIRHRKGWELKESEATPEHLFWSRRKALAVGLGGAAAGLGLIGGGDGISAISALAQNADPTADLYPAKRNDAFVLDRPLTPESENLSYNNFYEFGSSKRVAAAARALPTRPWTITVDGLVDKPVTIGIDDLIRKMQLEERLYRLRCVEAWSMTVPWTGFPLSRLIALAGPKSEARYVKLETFQNPKVATGQRQTWYPWPYTEGVTIEEAMNDLAFLATGAYGKPLANQMGAPLRLTLPWKYGFKSIKSIVRVSLVAERPKSFWEALQPSEYGFWANVNPEVSHPRWSQATEQVLGSGERRPTLPFNGYGEYVAGLYKDIKGERLYL